MIKIQNYPVFVKVGYFANERLVGQNLLVSIEAKIQPLAERRGNDALSDTVDYGALLVAIDEALLCKEIKLIETVAEVVEDALMRQFNRIASLEVTIEKPILPDNMGKGARVSVTSTCQRRTPSL